MVSTAILSGKEINGVRPDLRLCAARFVLASLSFVTLVSAVSSASERIVPLGKLGQKVVVAVVTAEQVGDDPADVKHVHVVFRVDAGEHQVCTNVADAGEGYDSTIRVGAYDFMKSSRQRRIKQLFISATIGAVHSRVYSLSGKTIRAIYTRDDGRVVVTPVRNFSGRYNLKESWPRNQWSGHENLGHGHFDPSTNSIVRNLAWINGQFRPTRPGPSTVDNPELMHATEKIVPR